MHQSVGIKSLAISSPSVKRTNDHYRNKYPEKVAQAEQETLAQVFSTNKYTPNSGDFDRAMQPYLSDPFRGAVNRYILGKDESSLTLETKAAKEAIKAGGFNPKDIDLMLVASMLPEQIGIGNAAFLINQIGLNCPAWNIESMQSGALVGLQTASAMVKSGEYRNVLVVVSCTYSRNLSEEDSLSWIAGDGAGAFLVGCQELDRGIISTKVINTTDTNNAYCYSIVKELQKNPQIRLQANKNMSQLISNHSAKFIVESCKGAINQAELTFSEIDFFVFSTPFAWFAELFITTLNIDPKLTLDMHPHYGNIGAALPIANLYYAAKLGKIKEDSLVLLFSIGGSSTAAATVMRWGDVALGAAPAIDMSDSIETETKDRELVTC